MERTSILLLSFEGAADLALALKDALKATQSCDFDVSEAALPKDSLDEQKRILAKTLARSRPGLVVLCLPASHQEHAQAVMGCLRQHLREVTIVIATESTQPEELYQMLELGAADFITPPFRPMDVLPRLWRLHSHAGRARCRRLGNRIGRGAKEVAGVPQAVPAG